MCNSRFKIRKISFNPNKSTFISNLRKYAFYSTKRNSNLKFNFKSKYYSLNIKRHLFKKSLLFSRRIIFSSDRFEFGSITRVANSRVDRIETKTTKTKQKRTDIKPNRY